MIHIKNGSNEIETYWKLSVEKLKHIAQTGYIYLYTVGRWLPSVMLSVKFKVDTEDCCYV